MNVHLHFLPIEQSLLNELTFPASLQWLRLIYENKIQQYSHSTAPESIDESLHTIHTRYDVLTDTYGFQDNLDLMSSLAEYEYSQQNYLKSYEISKRIIDDDPYQYSILAVHLCSLVELQMKNELFYLAHQLVQAYPDKAVSIYHNSVLWFDLLYLILSFAYTSLCQYMFALINLSLDRLV